jgi:hypothetical protein
MAEIISCHFAASQANRNFWNAPRMSGDVRRSPRYPFVATAEVTVEETGSVIATRLGDLSLHGCFIRTANPLSAGASILIRISAGNTVFQARGKVIYSQPNLGAGVEFQQVEQLYVTVLEEWLLEARGLNTPDQVT